MRTQKIYFQDTSLWPRHITGRRLGDRFREHLRDVQKDDEDASKPVARRFNLPNHSKLHMAVCGLSLHQGSTESRKTLEQRLISKRQLPDLFTVDNSHYQPS